ncbi:MAG TPA: phosphatase PAP2 family protein [Gemmatimonadaceae bacterium]|jgi:undecaprenyl-diphosphatase|nr:phosphatase PAP2 family protein [Gemmatimonadaceae bacterium]
MRRDPATGHVIANGDSRPWRRAIVVTAVGFVIAFAAGAGFALWLQSTGDWSAGLPWERELLLSMDPSAPAAIDWMMLALPWLGTNLTLAPIIAAFALWLWRKKGRPEVALELVLAVLGSLLLNALMKDVFDRPRPDLWPRRGQYEWAAYPSGHAIVGIAVYFTVTRVIHRELRWTWPYVVAIALLAVSLYSRLYLGVHWPTDVIGGLLLGAIWLGVIQVAFAPFHARRRERADTVTRDRERFGGRSSVEGAGA